MIAMKSVDTEEEIDQAKPAIKTLGGKIEKVADYPVPGTDIIHRAVVIRKIGKTPKGYPRRFAKIQKSPL
jgi:16S rRNA (guanine527-N7)-methyltransferase